MKKIINGKLYNTDTATDCGSWSNIADYRNFSYFSETLYRKRTGEFFLHGEGGPASRYSQLVDSNSWSGGEKIMPLTYVEAQKWAEEHLTADEYEAIFGAVSEDDSRVATTFSLSASTVETLRRKASAAGLNQSAYLERLILGE